MSKVGMNTTSWKNCEWYGLDEVYIPYPYIEDHALAYGYTKKDGSIEIEVYETFAYLCAFNKYGEFLCTLELPTMTKSGDVITIKHLRLLDKGLKPSEISTRL